MVSSSLDCASLSLLLSQRTAEPACLGFVDDDAGDHHGERLPTESALRGMVRRATREESLSATMRRNSVAKTSTALRRELMEREAPNGVNARGGANLAAERIEADTTTAIGDR